MQSHCDDGIGRRRVRFACFNSNGSGATKCSTSTRYSCVILNPLHQRYAWNGSRAWQVSLLICLDRVPCQSRCCFPFDLRCSDAVSTLQILRPLCPWLWSVSIFSQSAPLLRPVARIHHGRRFVIIQPPRPVLLRPPLSGMAVAVGFTVVDVLALVRRRRPRHGYVLAHRWLLGL